MSEASRRPDRTKEQEVLIERPGCPVTVIYPTEDNNTVTTFYIPENSRWSPGPHWHELYTEIFRVVQGRVKLVKNDVVTFVTPEDGEQRVPKYCVHEFMRADIDCHDGAGSGPGDQGDVIIEECVDPADRLKEVFFRNIIGSLQDRQILGRLLGLQIVLTSSSFDNYDVFIPGRLRWLTTHVIYALGSICARVLGLQAHYPEYTPNRLALLLRDHDGSIVKEL